MEVIFPRNLLQKISTRLDIIFLLVAVLDVRSMTIIRSKAQMLQEVSSDSVGNQLRLKDESKKMYNVLDLLGLVYLQFYIFYTV